LAAADRHVEATAQRDRAEDFDRSVGAARFLRECERLAAASAAS
jgi:hypothetical protein